MFLVSEQQPKANPLAEQLAAVLPLLNTHVRNPATIPADAVSWWPRCWPQGCAFEIAVGAVLTQNTRWQNVEYVLDALANHDVTTPAAVLERPRASLQTLIRTAGFYRIKAGYLIHLARFWQHAGGQQALAKLTDEQLQHKLAAVKGLGAESVADIMLYGFYRPVWVIDAYTRRFLTRLGFGQIAQKPSSQLAATLAEATLAGYSREQAVQRSALWHGLIVEHSKQHCRKTPDCSHCPLDALCPKLGV